MTRRGFTMIELLTGLIVFSVVMAGIFIAFVEMWKAQGRSIGLPASQQGAEQIVYKLANSFRSSANCLATDTGCVLNSDVQDATSTGCTIYSRNSSGAIVSTVFATSGTNFTMTTGGNTMVLASGATVTLTYYTSAAYNSTALTTYTPTNSTVASLIGVMIVANVSQSGGNTTYTTFVRLRNGP